MSSFRGLNFLLGSTVDRSSGSHLNGEHGKCVSKLRACMYVCAPSIHVTTGLMHMMWFVLFACVLVSVHVTDVCVCIICACVLFGGYNEWYVGSGGSNLGWFCAKQMLIPLYYLPVPYLCLCM